MTDPLILHIETATPVCSVALSKGDQLLGTRESAEEKAHSSLLTVFIDALLEETGTSPEHLNAICVSKGPGSYTGLRIGVSTTKGLAYGLNIPVIAINSLHAMARGITETGRFRELAGSAGNLLLCPMVDARRMEVYAAFYDRSFRQVRETRADIIDENSYAELLAQSPVVFFGTGAFKLKDVLRHPNVHVIDDFSASAKHMIDPALEAWEKKSFEDTAYFEPFYLKDFIATTPRKKVL